MADKNNKKIWDLLEKVSDPEIPVLTVVDMGIIRAVKTTEEQLEVVITPTYSGCPAMDMIEVEIRAVLQDHGYDNVVVSTVLSPAWTTEWMSESGKKKLKEYGIAPPEGAVIDKSVLFGAAKKIECPRCGSRNTEMLSQFGSTACKALYQCSDCKEPFDYFKCH
ncbi:1,2-phenylacetyl-CoA epoxidase subunit PaaD [Aureispira anguillae]|uniref:Phenylacetate-CoA oxygenase subunit PaaJ n=1 Tax=Aureispira anguillae TaxID=2864201 RepID=A0A915YDJ8_9BACT|nr:1,2-phenylacetyl-CoA epoxidase subunit PaaD [Aureispira anguillae]BDS11085.1 phenylacetate-CoA oxygenase subunit PaaJ [Aureispira anguillae]